MWIFSRYGFYSVTAGTDKKIQVRARNKDHLYNLKDEFPKIFKDKQVIELPNRDYRYRYILTPQEWGTVSAQLMSEVSEYSNFKGECLKRANEGQLDHRYEKLLHRIWHEHMGYQLDVHEPKGKKNFDGGTRRSGGMGYSGSTHNYYPSIDQQNSLWRDKQSQVYDADYESEDHVLDKRDASEILADLDFLPSQTSHKSLFIDTDVGEIFTEDSNRFSSAAQSFKKKNGKKKRGK